MQNLTPLFPMCNPNIGTIIQERPKVATYGEKISTTLARELEIS